MLLNLKTFNSLFLPYREADTDYFQEQNPSHREAMEEYLDESGTMVRNDRREFGRNSDGLCITGIVFGQ